ncbi:MAG: fibronectin/fibrinogen-binding protein [Clostridiales bacterium]|jgi:predicted ribosome quality control (RQC) complex YloA/Tae2 family protein|nr:fibronectin/fibrinogen-binding protein [Clostridiales bacterium]
MAFDGIITYAEANELSQRITLGKIEKVYQPGSEELLVHIHTSRGNVRLFMSCNSQSARVCLTEGSYTNPDQPPAFCMLLRKHLQGGRITAVRQKDAERIIEIDIEAQNEMGFSVCRRLIVEIMAKHSNIVLVDLESGKIIDSIKRISIDVNRYRQLLPGVIYQYPPEQDKTPFNKVTADTGLLCTERGIMSTVSGISPAIAREMIAGCGEDASLYSSAPAERLVQIVSSVSDGSLSPRVYLDDAGNPREFHITDLSEYEGLEVLRFDSVSECIDYYFSNRETSNLVRQKSMPLMKSAQAALDKALLKKKKLSEDLLSAENSDKYRLYGELLTANIHMVKPGDRKVTVTNYYDGSLIDIPLDEKLGASANAQRYFKKYSKARTAIHEKQSQLEDNEKDIEYLSSVIQNIEAADSVPLLESIRDELEQTGYVRRRAKASQRKRKAAKPEPLRYTLSDGTEVLVGRNNIENDWLTMKFASKTDVWMHTKDIPGSHLIVRLDNGRSLQDLPAELIYEAASIAAYHSKASGGDNVPVDYVPVRYVKKPAGSKPGMVIFTHNQTVYVKPQLPKQP